MKTPSTGIWCLVVSRPSASCAYSRINLVMLAPMGCRPFNWKDAENMKANNNNDDDDNNNDNRITNNNGPCCRRCAAGHSTEKNRKNMKPNNNNNNDNRITNNDRPCWCQWVAGHSTENWQQKHKGKQQRRQQQQPHHEQDERNVPLFAKKKRGDAFSCLDIAGIGFSTAQISWILSKKLLREMTNPCVPSDVCCARAGRHVAAYYQTWWQLRLTLLPPVCPASFCLGVAFSEKVIGVRWGISLPFYAVVSQTVNQTHRQRKNGRTDGRTNEQTNEQKTNRPTDLHVQMPIKRCIAGPQCHLLFQVGDFPS